MRNFERTSVAASEGPDTSLRTLWRITKNSGAANGISVAACGIRGSSLLVTPHFPTPPLSPIPPPPSSTPPSPPSAPSPPSPPPPTRPLHHDPGRPPKITHCAPTSVLVRVFVLWRDSGINCRWFQFWWIQVLQVTPVWRTKVKSSQELPSASFRDV